MITWPRVRIVFALIGMGVTALFLGDQILSLLSWLADLAESGKDLLP